MIHSWAYDVEIFPNLFSVTFINLKDYMKMFVDCVNEKGKPIALTEKLSVSEIKSRLDKIESKIFKISDSDDSQLLELAAYINNMQAHYDTIEDKDGKIITSRSLDYGFALTSHKSQGSTFDTALVDVNDIVFDKYGQPYADAEEVNRRLYVACSRCKNKLYLKFGR